MPPRLFANIGSVLDDDVIPFATYLNKNTVITKNGEPLQTIVIDSHNGNANVTGVLMSDVRSAIFDILGDDVHNYAFWLHVVRTKNNLLDNIKEQKNTSTINQIAIDRWSKQYETANNYDTKVYITVMHNGMSLGNTLSGVGMYLNKALLTYKHSVAVSRSTLVLQEAVLKMVKRLEQYNPAILTMVERDGEYYSEHLEFYNKFINFDNTQYRVPMANLSSVLNKSRYNVDFNQMTASNNDGKQYISIFTVKDTNGVGGAIVNDLMTHLEDVIICEFFHSQDGKKQLVQYDKQIEAMRNGEHDIIMLSGLTDFADKKQKPVTTFRHYVGIAVVAKSADKLQSSVAKLATSAAASGVVIAQEDIGLQRAFYAFIPGNFKFIMHTQLVTTQELCKFAYSYTFDNENIASFIEQKPLFIIPTTKNNPYAFGVLLEKPDIIISAAGYRQQTIFCNTILSHLVDAYSMNMFVIDVGSSSETFMRENNADVFKLSLNKNNQTNDSFNPFCNFGANGDFTNFLINAIAIMCYDAQMQITAEVITDITAIVANITTSSGSMLANELLLYFSDTFLEPIVKEWLLDDGKYAGLFDLSPLPLAEIQQNHRHYYAIDSSVIDNRNALDITSMAIFNRIWSYSSMSPNPSVIVVNDPFLLLQNGLIGQYIQPFITNRESGNRFFIFNINSTKEENFHDNFSRQEFFAHCDTQIHLSDCCATEKYAAIFNLSNAELYAIQNLSKNPNGAIIKQNGLVAPISINADSIFEDIADIMCDTIDVKRQFEAIRANIPAGESVIDKFLNKDSLTKTQDQIMAERLAKEQEALQQKQQADKDLANQILNAA